MTEPIKYSWVDGIGWTPANEDTYTLIPNGTELTDKQGYPKVKVRAYLVQHDQTGLTIKWEGASEMWYEMSKFSSGEFMNAFRTFSGWDKRKREKWYRDQYNRILTEEKNMNDYDMICFDDCVHPCAPALNYSLKTKSPQKAATKMNISTAAISNPIPTDQRQRDYLLARLSEVKYTKEDEFHTIFHLDPVKGPKSWNALVQAIKDGDFTIDEKYAEKEQYYTGDILNYVRWSKTKPDQEGYKAACKALSEAYETAKDEIVVSEPKDGLKVLEAFKAKTFH